MLKIFRRRPGSKPYRRLVRSEDPRRTARRFALYILSVIVAHTALIAHFEGLALADALWLTLTTVTTVGYGDFYAQTAAGRATTILLIYIGGIFVLFEGAAAYFDYRSDRRQRMLNGTWRWALQGHILIVDTPAQNPAQHIERLVAEFRASRRYGELPVLVLTTDWATGLPDSLQRLGVVHRVGMPPDPRALAEAGAAEAAIIIVLARHDADRMSDGKTFDILHRLRELGAKGRVLAEAVEDGNRARLKAAGAQIIVRPLRGYPEMIVRALVAPGAEQVIEDLFTSRADECWRYDIRVKRRWGEVVQTLVEQDVGIPIAYRCAATGSTLCNPKPNDMIDADKLYVIVREGNSRPDAEVAALLGR